MSEHDPQEHLRESLIEALLRSAYENDSANDQQRIEKVMQCLALEPIELERIELAHEESTASHQIGSRVQLNRGNRGIVWAVAASVACGLFIAFQVWGTSGSALAAVQRSIATAQEYVVRQYRVTVTIGDSTGNNRVISSDLYVQGSDRFALRHPALLPGAHLWLGSDGQDAWLVPALGPIRVGDETGLGRWLSQREQLSTPYLHVESMLARMGRGYRLNEKPATKLTLGSGTTVSCQQIEGNLRWRNQDKAPDKVKLWSDAQTGVAMRLELVWNVPTGSLGHHQIVIEFVDSPALADDWFAFAGHSTSNRRVLRFDATD